MVSPVTTRITIVESKEIKRTSTSFPLRREKQVIRLTPAGRKKKARFSSKKSLAFSIISSFTMPV